MWRTKTLLNRVWQNMNGLRPMDRQPALLDGYANTNQLFFSLHIYILNFSFRSIDHSGKLIFSNQIFDFFAFIFGQKFDWIVKFFGPIEIELLLVGTPQLAVLPFRFVRSTRHEQRERHVYIGNIRTRNEEKTMVELYMPRTFSFA